MHKHIGMHLGSVMVLLLLYLKVLKEGDDTLDTSDRRVMASVGGSFVRWMMLC